MKRSAKPELIADLNKAIRLAGKGDLKSVHFVLSNLCKSLGSEIKEEVVGGFNEKVGKNKEDDRVRSIL